MQDVTEVLKRLFRFMEKFMELSRELRDHLTLNMQPFHYPEDKTLFEIGDAVNRTYFISSGYMTCSEFRPEIDDQVLEIFTADQIVAPPSFHDQKPSRCDLKVIGGTFVLFLTHAQMEEVYELFPYTQKLARLIQNFYKVRDHDRLLMLNKDAIDSVYDFYTLYPDLLVQGGGILRDSVIGSFLMMDERTLGRNRAKLVEMGKLNYRVG